MKIVVPVVIVPEKGESIWELSGEIFEAIKQGKIGDLIFVRLPNDRLVEIKGKKREDIRDDISTNFIETHF